MGFQSTMSVENKKKRIFKPLNQSLPDFEISQIAISLKKK